MKTLNVTVNLGNANRWRVFAADPIESISRFDLTFQLINNGGALVSEAKVQVRNGQSDRVSIDTGAVSLGAALVVEKDALSTPTGYTDAFAAVRAAANTMSARRDALETWALSAGVAGANMAGT